MFGWVSLFYIYLINFYFSYIFYYAKNSVKIGFPMPKVKKTHIFHFISLIRCESYIASCKDLRCMHGEETT